MSTSKDSSKREAEMPCRPERQYRSFAASNFRAIDDVDGDEPTYKVRGYFTTFDEPYELYPRTKYWPAEYEQVDPHALDDCDMSDVIMQFDHCGDVLARQRNGSLVIGVDEVGGWCEATLDGCQRARDMFESIKNGLVVEMSFGFIIASDDDGEGYTTTKDEQGDYHTTITRISKIFDVSCVSIPANPGTDIDEVRKRSYLYSTIEADRAAEREAKAALEREESERKSRMRRRAKALSMQQF